jgi:hypothetical protein
MSDSKIAAAFRMAAVAIEFNSFARSFTRSAAVLSVWLRWTGTYWVLAFIFIVVCHQFLRNFPWAIG